MYRSRTKKDPPSRWTVGQLDRVCARQWRDRAASKCGGALPQQQLKDAGDLLSPVRLSNPAAGRHGSSPPYELRLRQARCRCSVFPVPKPLLKACFVIVEDNRYALGGFDRQPLLLGLLRDADQWLAQKQQPSASTDARNRSSLASLSARHQFGPRSV